MLSFAVASVAFAAAVSAQTTGYHAINLPGMQEVVPACAPYTIVWTPSDQYSGAVTFQLIGGATQATLVPIGEMFGNVPGSAGSYTWDVPCDAGSEAIYGLRIHEVSDLSIFQYSMPFQIQADGNVNPSATDTMSGTMSGTMSSTTAASSSIDAKPTDTNTTSSASEVPTTSAMNATVTTPTLSNPITTLTSMTTAEETPTSTPDDDLVSVASAYRMTTGSFAVLAVAAAFLTL